MLLVSQATRLCRLHQQSALSTTPYQILCQSCDCYLGMMPSSIELRSCDRAPSLT